MTIDLAHLGDRHPNLPAEVLAPYVHRAAIALQRRHVPGVPLGMHVNGQPAITAPLHWPEKPETDAEFLDTMRTTEDGAEAIALAVVQELHGWTALRRIQRRSFADWLLADRSSDTRIALEVGGTDKEDDSHVLREKTAQVSKCLLTARRAACVVRFREPRCKLMELPEVPQ